MCNQLIELQADLIIASFAQVSQTYPTIATATTEEKTLWHNFLPWREIMHPLTNRNDLPCPLVTRDNWITIVADWPDTPIELHIAPTDADSTRADQHIFRSELWLL